MITLSSRTSQVTIDLHGGYVDGWNVAGREILYRGTDLKRRGIPILFPYFGKPSPDLPQHGFGRDTLWKLASQSDTSIMMRISHADISDEARSYYPYQFEVCIGVSLRPHQTMEYSLIVKNTGTVLLPISPGLHPYWSIAHATKGKLQIDGLSGFDARAIDWDDAPPDTDYDFHNPLKFSTDEYALVMRDISPQGSTVRQITVWSQPAHHVDHDFICIEPICGKRGGYIDDPIRVLPQSIWEMKLNLTVDDYR
ncbi:MAG: hypothetical protein WCO78_03520 [Candidatus Roizmanbacteria bacterium]